MSTTTARRLAAALQMGLIAGALGCTTQVGSTSGDGDENDNETPPGSSGEDGAAVTYYRDVLPIVQAKCAECHTEGGPTMALDQYEVAAPLAGAVASAVTERRMPPLLSDPACQPYEGSEGRLTDKELQTFQEWAELGAPEGDPADAPPPGEEPSDPIDALGEASNTFATAEKFDFANQQQDLYWCFRFDPALTDPRDLIAVDIVPDNKQIVHHVIVFREPDGAGQETGLPGFECDPVPPNAPQFLTGWVPGAQATILPEDTGMRLQPSDQLIMQVHYNAQPDADPGDRTQMKVWYADDPIDTQVRVIWSGSIDIEVPPGEAATAQGACEVPGDSPPVEIIGVAPHMHEVGTEFREVVLDENGNEAACLVDIDRWDFDWQRGYFFPEPVEVQPGQSIQTTCGYKNEGDTTVQFGEGTGDEMCFGFNYVVNAGELPEWCFEPCASGLIDCQDLL